MKKQVIPALLLLMGMLSSLGVFLFAFPFWDAVLWMLYIPVLLFAVVVYNRLLLRRRKKVILILAGGMLLLGVLSFSLLQEGLISPIILSLRCITMPAAMCSIPMM